MFCIHALPERLPCGVALLLLVAVGCRQEPPLPAPRPVTPKPLAEKEGRSWNHAELGAYLHAQGVMMFQLGDLRPAEGLSPEYAVFVDNEASSRKKVGEPFSLALKEKEAGTVIIFRHRTAETAAQQIRPEAHSSFLWGRFIGVIWNPPLRGEKETPETEGSRRKRSKQLLKAIREALET